MSVAPPTDRHILDVAQSLMQVGGYNAFSYAVAPGALPPNGSVAGEARLLLAGIEGAMLAARAHGDPAHFDAVTRRLLDAILPPA